MKRYILILFALFAATLSAVAQRPLYIVNGVETEEIESIPPDDIENIESLPADEETIARYGEKAANGVILISLRYDKPAIFEAGTTFDEYIAGQVKWDDDEPAARIILRYTVTPEGKAVLAQELESTDNRLKRRVLKALSEAPHWHPAQKNGVAVASEGVLHIQLPKGKRMPRPVELVWRCPMLPHAHITLSELQRLVKETLHERFALPVWVSAEISEVIVNYSGHCYLELIEKGGDNGVPLAQSRAVIWRTAYSRIAGYFEAETGQRLAAGIKILAKVAVNYHELYGFSLQITDIDPAYTLGDMQRQRQQTIDCLHKEGVWDMNREVGMPAVVQRIAIVSSANAAGYQDFCKEIGKSPYRFRLTLFDAFMQGAAAEESIVAALCAVADRMEEFDAVVIIRGGGSASDLNCFNAYRLCTHVAQFPLPVLTGIGHDKDTSVADMVAHTALKTPTAVAGWLVERMDTIDAWLDNAALQLRDNVLVTSRAQELRLQELSSHLLFHAKGLLRQRGMALEQMRETLAASAGNFLARQASRLGNAAELVAGRSPERILRLGFAIVRTGGKAVFSAAQVGKGDTLDIEVADGRIEGTVQYTETK